MFTKIIQLTSSTMKKTRLVGLFLLLLAAKFPSTAQDFNCLAEWQWLKTTFEDNDAGFSRKLEEKGESSPPLESILNQGATRKICVSVLCPLFLKR